ncbi:MAG: MSCRAMM family adhesin SdrC [Clostridiales bacterium]|nr:MSCRAMM family adhesin SdrC [Clostridiales bacterium]
MKKKIIALFLSFILLISLAACGGNTAKTEDISDNDTETATDVKEVPDDTAEAEEDESEAEESTESEVSENADDTATEDEDAEQSSDTDEESDADASEEVEDADASTDSETETDDAADSTEELVDGMRPEIKQAIDDYEAFFDEYCEFMITYSNSDDPTSLLGEYAEFMTTYVTTMASLEAMEDEDLNDAEMAYFLEAYSRIMTELTETTAEISG